MTPSSSTEMQTHPDSERRVALVTGGAMGIGAEVCERLASAGHQVLVADLDVAAAEATAVRLRAAGADCAAYAVALALDVGRPESVEIGRAHV